MFNMDFQRIVLFGAIGLVLAMLWYKWGVFQAQYTPQNSSQIDLITEQGGKPLAAQDIPNAPLVTRPAHTDALPEVETGVSIFAPSIRVTTDLVRAQIDPHGGDLISLELLAYPVSVDMQDVPFSMMYRDANELFIAQSGLIGSGEREYPNHGVTYSVATYEYDLGNQEQLEVVLDWVAPDEVEYQKIFRFKRNSYRIEVDFRVRNRSAQPWQGFVYGQLKQTEIVQKNSLGFLGALPSYYGAAIYTEQEKYEKVSYDDMRDSVLDVSTTSGWVSMLQHYFVAAWLPVGADDYEFFSGVSDAPQTQYRIGYKTTQPVHIDPGSIGEINTVLFVGPKEQDRLRKQNTKGLLLTVDYGWFTPIAAPLFWLLNKIHGVVGNWGWSIILLTLLIKAVFYPLSATSYKSMAKMKRLQPRLQTLKERYGDDKQRFQKEMMQLYKAEKVNPAGGCLPILVQIPVFISLYWTLLESVELRQAEFIFWLNDLSIPDPYFVLPLVMGASMLAQHFLNPAAIDPLQRKIMLAMPIVFTVFFLWFPAGLVLYWVANNLLSIAQQYYVTRKYQHA